MKQPLKVSLTSEIKEKMTTNERTIIYVQAFDGCNSYIAKLISQHLTSEGVPHHFYFYNGHGYFDGPGPERLRLEDIKGVAIVLHNSPSVSFKPDVTISVEGPCLGY
ncbi:MAG: hypothetical protein JEZ12_25515 [Desulfobacterium sp.]|nr:hypothetical protein [Desulfobacterium sp.]